MLQHDEFLTRSLVTDANAPRSAIAPAPLRLLNIMVLAHTNYFFSKKALSIDRNRGI